MKNKARDARRHSFSATDSLLPDANFWLAQVLQWNGAPAEEWSAYAGRAD